MASSLVSSKMQEVEGPWGQYWQHPTGLKITAGQQTMSGLIVGLTGQTLVWPVILTGHFWMLVA